MKAIRAMVTVLAAAALAGCAMDGAGTGGGPAAASAAVEAPRHIVAARQSAFHLTGAAMGNMKGAIDRGDDPKGQAYAARGVAKWAHALAGAFPAGTAAVTPSRARAEIWTNRADFEAKAAAFAAAAARLAELAQANDKEGFAAQHRATAATCAACHDLYQVPQNRGG